MRREPAFRALLVLGSFVLALAVLETACRILGLGGPNPHLTGDQGLFVPDPDPKISYRLKPGFTGAVYGSHVEINSRGLREAEALGYESEPGAIRILCLGDSVVFGFGVSAEETFPSVLETLLTQDSDAEFETVNTGVPGYNTVQEVRFLETEGVQYQPDLVLLFLVANDPESIRKLDKEGHLLPAPEDIWLRLSQKYGSLSPPESVFYVVNACRRAIVPMTSKHKEIVNEVVEYYTEEIFEYPGWRRCQEATGGSRPPHVRHRCEWHALRPIA